ncbi:MAG: GAF domain-containing protein [Magnetococcus sp. MYC-9]
MLSRSAHRTLLDLQLQLGSIREVEALPPVIAQAAALLCEAERATLFLLDWERMHLCSGAALGMHDGIQLELKMGIVGLAFLRKEIINVIDAYNVPFFNREVDRESGYKTETVLVIPVIDEAHRVLGAVQLLNKREGCFNLEDEQRLAAAVKPLSSHSLFQSLDQEQARSFVDRWVAETECERGSLFVFNAAQGTLDALYASGMEGQPAIGVRVNLGVAGWVLFTGQTLVIDDAYQSEFFSPEIDIKTGYRTHTLAAVPLLTAAGEPLGVVEIINKKGGTTFTQSDVEGLQALTRVAANALENALFHQEQELQFHSLVEVMTASMDDRNSWTVGHSQLVSAYACGIARQLGLPDSDVDVVRMTALLHDCGRLGVADGSHIGHKEQGRQRVMHTRAMLGKIRFSRKYRHLPQIVASHLENMEGSGSGLLNRYVPFLAKIVTVANLFEALTVDRHYRKCMPAEEALSILKQGAGKKFDMAIVEAMERYWLQREGGSHTEPVQRMEDLPVDSLKIRPMQG